MQYRYLITNRAGNRTTQATFDTADNAIAHAIQFGLIPCWIMRQTRHDDEGVTHWRESTDVAFVAHSGRIERLLGRDDK